jgi:hypothetical protein
MSSSTSCADYSFGLVPRDLQVNNAKVNHVLAACEVKLPQVPVASLQTSISQQIPTTGPIAVEWNLPNQVYPLSFQTSPSTFTIPVDGLYEVNATVLVTEYNGTATDCGLFLSKNNNATTALLNYSQIPANQSAVLVGSSTNRYVKGDVVTVGVGGIFGSSPNIAYVGTVNGLDLSRITILQVNP